MIVHYYIIQILRHQQPMFYFIRHAQSTFNNAKNRLKMKYGLDYATSEEFLELKVGEQLMDASINQEGYQQAFACRQKIKDLDIDLVVVSPLRRTLQTCHILFSQHKSKPKIIVDAHLRQYIANACDIGDKLSQSMQLYTHFDYSKIKDIDAWYIHHILEDQYKNKLVERLNGVVEDRRQKAKKLGQQYLKDFIDRVYVKKEQNILKQIKTKMRQRRQYIKQTYGNPDKNVIIVTHYENVLALFGQEVENCQILPIPYNQL